MEVPFKQEIQAAAKERGLDPALVAAICFVESGFNPASLRYESAFRKKYIDPNPKYMRLDPGIRTLLSSSLGLMQTMGVVAHEDGLALDRLEDLFEADVGLEYGCRQLKQLIERYWDSGTSRGLSNAIAAYNSGTARLGKTGKYVNQGYVDKVMTKYREFKGGDK